MRTASNYLPDVCLFPGLASRGYLRDATFLPRLAHTQPLMSLAAHTYAEQLLRRGHGYPMWFPEPSVNGLGDILIGDVGYIFDGSFVRLFSATLPAEHPINKNGVPDSFKLLQLGSGALVRKAYAYLQPGAICSRSVRRVEASLQVAAGGSKCVYLNRILAPAQHLFGIYLLGWNSPGRLKQA